MDEIKKLQHKIYYLKHKQEHNRKMTEYHKVNIDRHRQSMREYYHKNKDKFNKRPLKKHCDLCDKEVSYANFAVHCRSTKHQSLKDKIDNNKPGDANI